MKNTNPVEHCVRKHAINSMVKQPLNVTMTHAMKDVIVKKVMYSITKAIVLNQNNVHVSFSSVPEEIVLKIFLGKTTKKPELTTRPSNGSRIDETPSPSAETTLPVTGRF